MKKILLAFVLIFLWVSIASATYLYSCDNKTAINTKYIIYVTIKDSADSRYYYVVAKMVDGSEVPLEKCFGIDELHSKLSFVIEKLKKE
jgi:hypothetical protein